ncbi:MAG: hypothetical protein JWQ86_4614 [Mycobacterium sp.]|nr:hypothetical protein [Mycobacterium sp.]
MTTGQHLDCFGGIAVTGHHAMVVPVGTDQVGQQLGVGGVGLGPRDVVAVAVAGRSQRVDREHLVSGGGQGIDPQPSVGFDPNDDLGWVGGVLGDQLVQPGNPGQAFGQPS